MKYRNTNGNRRHNLFDFVWVMLIYAFTNAFNVMKPAIMDEPRLKCLQTPLKHDERIGFYRRVTQASEFSMLSSREEDGKNEIA